MKLYLLSIKKRKKYMGEGDACIEVVKKIFLSMLFKTNFVGKIGVWMGISIWERMTLPNSNNFAFSFVDVYNPSLIT